MKIYITKDCINQGIRSILNATLHYTDNGSATYIAKGERLLLGRDFVLTETVARKKLNIEIDRYAAKLEAAIFVLNNLERVKNILSDGHE